MITRYTTDDLPTVIAYLTDAIEREDVDGINRWADLAMELEDLERGERAAAERAKHERIAARYENFVAAGLPDDEAEAKATGRSLKSVRRERFKSWAHSEGHFGDDYRGLVTQVHDRQVEMDYYRAEAACNGHMLNAVGERLGIDPASFWHTDSVQYVRKYASEELMSWFDEHGRATWNALHESIINGGHYMAVRRNEGLLR